MARFTSNLAHPRSYHSGRRREQSLRSIGRQNASPLLSAKESVFQHLKAIWVVSQLTCPSIVSITGIINNGCMQIRFYLDPDTDLPHILDHGVREDEVEDVLKHSGEDRPGTEGSRIALGQTRAGRYLRVIYVPDPELESLFVVTAYELTGKALTAYRRRQRRKKR